MKFLFALLATIFFAAPAWAVDVQMGYDGNLVFEPSEVTISAGESVHFVNNMLPCLLYTSPSPRDQRGSRMPSSA